MSGIFKKLLGSHLLVIVISFIILTIIISFPLKNYYRLGISEKLEVSASLIAELVQENLRLGKSEDIQFQALMLSSKIPARITITDLRGKVLADSEEQPVQMENHRNHPEVKEAMAGKIGRTIRHSKTTGFDMLYVAVPVNEGAVLLGVVRVSMPLAEVQGKINQIQRIIIICIFIGIIIAFILSIITSSSFAKPLVNMKRTAEMMVRGDYEKRLTVSRDDELGALAASFNILFDEIQKNISGIIKDKEKLSTILASMIEGVLVLDGDDNIIIWNDSFLNMFELEAEKIESMNYAKVIPSNKIKLFIEEGLSGKQSISKEISVKNPQKQVFLVQLSYIGDESTNMTGTVVVLHDITPFKKLELLKSEFIANASHEIKTPVTAITASVETLINGAMDSKKDANEFLKIINVHSIRLNNIVNDLLILSKLESEDILEDIQSVDLRAMIEHVVLIFRELINDKKLHVDMNIAPDLKNINANHKKIEQVFINLIDNAIKFSLENGNIQLVAENMDDKVMVHISDKGIGIGPEHLERIFERFYRVDSARSRAMGGTGLGLSIVKHIVQLHRGEINVKSIPGNGSEFTIIFPAI